MPSRTPPRDQEDQQGGGSRDWTRALREAGPYLGLGTTLAATVLLGLGGGYWLDGWLGSRPLCLFLGGTLGAGVGLYNFFRVVSDLGKRQAGRQR